MLDTVSTNGKPKHVEAATQKLQPDAHSTRILTLVPAPKAEAPAPIAAPVEQPAPAVPAKGSHGTWKGMLRLGLVAATILLLSLAGYRAYAVAMTHEGTDDAFIDGHIVQVAPRVAGYVQQVLVDDNQQVKKGQLLVQLDPADYEVKVQQARAALAAAEEKHQSSNIHVGVTRQSGDAGIEQAQAAVMQAESTVSRAVSGVETSRLQAQAAQARARQAQVAVETAKRNLDQYKAQLTSAQVEQRRSKLDVDRYRSLLAEDAVTRQEYDHAAAAYDAAVAGVQAAQSHVASGAAEVQNAQANYAVAVQSWHQAESQVNEAAAQVSQSRAQVQDAQGRLTAARTAPDQTAITRVDARTAAADVAAARAALRQAELNLAYTKVYASQDGRVTRKTVEAGNYVQTGQSMLAVVSNNVWVVANYKETQLGQIRVGQKVNVRVDAYPGVKFAAHVDSIQDGSGARFSLLPPENATGNYVKVVQRVPVKIVFDHPDPRYVLGPGMSVYPQATLK